MMTYEMIGVADENGRTYESKYGTYNVREGGFKFNDEAFKYPRGVLCGMLLHEDLWRLKVDKKKMTKEDIEKALGYQIEIINENPVDKSKPKSDESQNFFDEFFGLLSKSKPESSEPTFSFDEFYG